MRAPGYVFGFIGLFLVALSSSAARAQCPSKDYFRVDAQNAISGFDTTLNSTVCVSIVTSPTRINMKSLIVAEVINTAKLEQALINQFARSAACGFFNIGGWDLSEANVSFLGSLSSARIRVTATAKPCQSARGGRVTYQVPLTITYANNIVSLRLDEKNAKLTFGKSEFGVPAFISATITNKLNAVLADKTLDTTPFIPDYVRAFAPSVSQPSLVLQSKRLTLKISLSGQITKTMADQLLTGGVDRYAVPSIIRWFSGGVPTS
ncbi:MAG: hypothetical protein QOD40_157 [Alphaproteobacteria bacterium]|jgi:hypothetical protein|nr:hypothetical protein [Alphaproteobacteria bacterium]